MEPPCMKRSRAAGNQCRNAVMNVSAQILWNLFMTVVKALVRGLFGLDCTLS